MQGVDDRAGGVGAARAHGVDCGQQLAQGVGLADADLVGGAAMPVGEDREADARHLAHALVAVGLAEVARGKHGKALGGKLAQEVVLGGQGLAVPAARAVELGDPALAFEVGDRGDAVLHRVEEAHRGLALDASQGQGLLDALRVELVEAAGAAGVEHGRGGGG